MANEYIDQLRPRDFFRQNGAPIELNSLAPSGVAAGLRIPKGDTQGFTAVVYVAHNLTIATGFTFGLNVVDDGTDAEDLGKVVRFGITVKRLVSGTDDLTLTSAATEQTVDVTLDATTGQVVAGSLAIGTANLDSVATGDIALIRVRRIGTASQDTCRGAVLLNLVTVRNT
jgi:hypothetical protein